MPECSETRFAFQPLGSRAVIARFNGGYVTSDGGALLLREVEHRTGILRRVATCFTDQRAPGRIEHPVEALVKQRVYALTRGDEDLNDHDQLRRDPLLAVLVGTRDPTGQHRKRARDAGNALAGKSTLNRLELCLPQATPTAQRYKKILLDPDAVDRVLVELFLEAHAVPPPELVLDLDATDDPVHGHQEDRFFHGYYGHDCYLPRYIFAGEFLLCARLRAANRDASAGALAEIERIVSAIHQRWPAVRITLRADAGFCRESLMAWCEAHDIASVFGLATNARLLAQVHSELGQAQAQFAQTGQPARVFTEFRDRTLESWTQERRVVAKAEYLERRLGLRGTEMAHAQCGTIRLHLLQIGAVLSIGVRRLRVALASGYPYATLFQQVYAQLRC